VSVIFWIGACVSCPANDPRPSAKAMNGLSVSSPRNPGERKQAATEPLEGASTASNGTRLIVPLADSTIYEMEKRGNGTQH
jgi:hypothetical protein